ncbi:potassium channel subfamily K member 12-like, partial [Pollicipes pollicipes]|uniref:potassium channel subfamily K member 12-like n=1 Tax=Pollicipes pollicipes TaxID=41117 RepID=UPI001884968A
CLPRLRRNEDNWRFLLLGPVLLLYLLAGAALFQWAEGEAEDGARRTFRLTFEALRRNTSASTGAEALRQLLAGRPHWDFAGSFHFCCTVISTIGWGWTAPHTVAGRLLLIFYGIFGCAGGILFFNLFLERFITLLSFLMRTYHAWRADQQVHTMPRPNSAGSCESRVHRWRPAVRWVLLFLLLCTCLVLQLAALLYVNVERWDYVKAVYYSFVSFATIGFGDVVTGVQTPPAWYSVVNFLLTVVGVCCMYSLFNIVSIVIKQVLNWSIRRVNGLGGGAPSGVAKASPAPGLNAATARLSPQLLPKGTPSHHGQNAPLESLRGRRRNSMLDGITYTRENLQANRVSLAVMQNRLHDSVHQSRSHSALAIGRHHDDELGRVSIGSLGSVAIVSKKLEADD